ncbi:hypothetical protein [Methylosinus sporium]|uniref:Uncharacterized protein n=1 Tax=Methylosinus sporium TaxID=428 RepID=A0A2U1SSS0_METSR|nr:hypothetical protein [Methylosinus sporium]PWB94666.1 hypothetical protein C5689_06275 [Methylosinus sporium]
MLAFIKKSFPYAHDGIHVEELAAGSTREIADSVFDGLEAAGYVEAPKPQPIAPIEPPAAEAPAATEQENSGSEEAPAATDAAEFSVRHIGRGKYDIFIGDERYTHDAMTKDEADAALAAMI